LGASYAPSGCPSPMVTLPLAALSQGRRVRCLHAAPIFSLCAAHLLPLCSALSIPLHLMAGHSLPLATHATQLCHRSLNKGAAHSLPNPALFPSACPFCTGDISVLLDSTALCSATRALPSPRCHFAICAVLFHDIDRGDALVGAGSSARSMRTTSRTTSISRDSPARFLTTSTPWTPSSTSSCLLVRRHRRRH
jgi:hypothetical protein